MSEDLTEAPVVVIETPPYVQAMWVYRITDPNGSTMYLDSVEKSIEGIRNALHHLEQMPDSMAVELVGLDGSKVMFTKGRLPDLLAQMEAAGGVTPS